MDIDDLISEAWKRIKPRLEDEPALLAARIARRRTPTLMRPPRAWCLVLRASDRRLIDFVDGSNSITLNAAALRELCQLVHVSGEFLDEVAAKLGTTPVGLTSARIANVLTAQHYPLLGGRRGKPIPLLYHDDGPLDPNALLFEPPDPVWSWTAPLIAGRIPDDLCVTLTRTPYYRSHASKHAYDENRHPELDSAPPRRTRRLPSPMVDPACWYKWSRSGYYLGSDPSNWRKDFKDLGERPPRDLPRRAKSARQRPSTSKGSEHFNGYHWQCPTCHKRCRRLYYPLPPLNLLTDVPRLAQIVDIPPLLPLPGGERAGVRGEANEPGNASAAHERAQPTHTFACVRCHRVDYFSRCSRRSWNRLIAWLTQGLLYGHEVKKPDWLTPDRKRPYRARPGRAPSKRREQILRLIQVGAPTAAIAKELGISPLVVRNHLHVIYREHNVVNRAALAQKLGCLEVQKVPRPRFGRDEILPHLLAGKSLKQIAAETGVRYASVCSSAMRAYKMKGAKSREDFARATNSPLPPKEIGERQSTRRDKLARPLIAG